LAKVVGIDYQPKTAPRVCSQTLPPDEDKYYARSLGFGMRFAVKILRGDAMIGRRASQREVN